MAIKEVSPYLRYDDADAALGWVERVLGFTGTVRWRDATGKTYEADIHAGSATCGVSNSGGASHAQWQLELDPARASEVEVRFIETGQAQTRVELEHRHLERNGEGYQNARSTLENDNSSPLYLHRFADLVRGA